MNLAPCWIEIDLGRLRRNLRAVRRRLGRESAEVLAVVKADAYGHGMLPVAQTLAKEGVRFFGVVSLKEALALRGACSEAQILVMGSFHRGEVARYIEHRITPTISSLEDAEVFAKGARAKTGHYPVQVKVDTGMGRLGVWHEEADALFERLVRQKFLTVAGLYTHFANADAEDKRHTEAQTRLFEKMLGVARTFGLDPSYVHAANSMGLAHHGRSLFNLVRPGILLYGVDPGFVASPGIDVQPILSFKTRVAFLKEVAKGRSISYGSTYKTRRDTRIAVLPVGYSDGYRIGFSNKAKVLIRGRRYPVVGRVTMDHTMVDVGQRSPVRRWDEVTLIGEDKRQRVTSSELATLASTIPYEILCGLSSRVPRIYK